MQASYFQTAWADIEHSPGWFGKICLLGLLLFIPVFGPIVLYGYAFGWARDMAWDVHRPMPQRIFSNEDGQLFSRGFFAWLLIIVAGIIPNIILLAGGDSTFWLVVSVVADLFLSMFAMVGIMRMAIYGRLGAGFQLGRMWAMVKHDANGLLRILGMVVLISLIAGIAFTVVAVLAIMLIVAAGLGAGAAVDWQALSYSLQYGTSFVSPQMAGVMQAIAPILGLVFLIALVLVYIAFVVEAWLMLMQARAMGYWTRQFDVAHWGGQDDPMPFEVQQANAQRYAAQAQAQQQPNQWQPPVGQPPYQDQYGQWQAPTQQAAPWEQQPGQGQYQQPPFQGQQAPWAGQAPWQQGPAAQQAAQPHQPEPQPQAGQPQQPAPQQPQPASQAAPQQQPAPQQPQQPAPQPQAGQPQAAEPQQPAPAAEPAPAAPPAYAGRPSSMPKREHHDSPVAPKWEKVDLDKLGTREEGEGEEDAPRE